MRFILLSHYFNRVFYAAIALVALFAIWAPDPVLWKWLGTAVLGIIVVNVIVKAIRNEVDPDWKYPSCFMGKHITVPEERRTVVFQSVGKVYIGIYDKKANWFIHTNGTTYISFVDRWAYTVNDERLVEYLTA